MLFGVLTKIFRMRIVHTLSLAIFTWSFSAAIVALELHGVDFPPTSTIDNQRLVLNGCGTRTYGLFRNKIYVAGLYLQNTSDSDQQILNSEGIKQIKMRYMRKIDQDDMRRGWDYYFNENCPDHDCSAYTGEIAEFQAAVIAATKTDDYDYIFTNQSVRILVNNQLVATIEGADFSRLLLSTWIGAAPPTKALKNALLGTSD